MNIFLQAAAAVFTPSALFFMLVGTFFGILCGAMPGLSAVMAVSILLPFTFSLKGTGIMMLLGTFCGAIYGGSITAILINTPARPTLLQPAWTDTPWHTDWDSLDGP